MATKVYGISGYTTTIMRIPAGDGKAWILCEFTRGCQMGAYSRPATYVTTDKTVQQIIEKSPYFNKRIKLVKSYEDDTPMNEQQAAAIATKVAAEKKADVQEAPVAESNDEPKVFEDVTSYEQAVTILKGLGAKATQLRSVEAIKKYMSQHNVTFPNYNFD